MIKTRLFPLSLSLSETIVDHHLPAEFIRGFIALRQHLPERSGPIAKKTDGFFTKCTPVAAQIVGRKMVGDGRVSFDKFVPASRLSATRQHQPGAVQVLVLFGSPGSAFLAGRVGAVQQGGEGSG